MAALAIGLREDSRIKMRLSGRSITLDQVLAAAALDELRFIAWTKTKHGKRYTGKSILKELMDPPKKNEYESFDSPEELEAYLKSFEV